MPETVCVLKGKSKVAALSLFARESAKISALKSNFSVEKFDKDEKGVPLPSNGIFWSVSHKPDIVAGVVSTQKIGIDIERIKDVSDALFKRIVSPEERICFGDQDSNMVFFRAFTAKEAVVKQRTEGITGLSKVKIKTVVDDTNLMVECSGKKYWVEHFYFDNYLASVTKERFDVQWTIG